ncbi:MAG: Hsp20/alpha crystallin family protein [Gemmatimonadaceae bacterium]
MMPSLSTASPEFLTGAFMANPFEFMRRMNAEMDRVFEDAGFGRGMPDYPATTFAGRGITAGGRTSNIPTGAGAGVGTFGATGAWMPQIETLERDDSLVLRADLPGIDRNDIHVDLEEGILTLSGERRQQHEERHEGVYRSERSYGSFYRAIPLPDGVEEDRIAATYENGVLEVVIPLPEQKAQRARKIEIR